MIEAVPKGWFSGDYLLRQPHGTVAELDVAGWREKAEFEVSDGRYRVYREGGLGAFVLESQGQMLARAVKPSAFRARFEVHVAGRTFEVRRGAWGSRNFGVFDGGLQVGSVRRAGMFTRRTIIELPGDWPLAVQVFVFWLALVIWNREQSDA